MRAMQQVKEWVRCGEWTREEGYEWGKRDLADKLVRVGAVSAEEAPDFVDEMFEYFRDHPDFFQEWIAMLREARH